MSTLIGFVCGTRLGAPWTWIQLVHRLLGTFLIASGLAALNQWYEREGDGLMELHAQSVPSPSGRVSPQSALIFGIVIAAAGFLELYVAVNPLTGGLALFTLASYLFVYTPLKRVSPVSTTIGAIPGAMPPPHRLRGSQRAFELRSGYPLRDPLRVAVPALLRDCVDV